MGMSEAEFWNMSPVVFFRKVDGHFQRENRAGVYFRETFSLLHNINRGEKNPAIEGPEVIRLPGEKKKREPRRAKIREYSLEETASIACRYNDYSWPPPWKPADRDFTKDELLLIRASKWRELPIWQDWNAAKEAEAVAQETEPNQPT